VAFPERACYCAAKAGVMALTKVLGCEWARYNINVNAVAPGYVETDLVKNLAAKGTLDMTELAGRAPMGRLAKASEIADCVTFLASEESQYIQGQTIVVDGGWTAFGYLESWLHKG
jgi:NAD(P)-dependent dehydrogenase (short-subunit alcohol dehydrogenase family)